MIRATVNASRSAVIEDVPIPQARPGEIVLKVECALTCGKDKLAWNNGEQTPLGREFSGTVHQVGAGVTKFAAGQAVMTTCSSSCHTCFSCQRGREGYCEHFADNATQHGMAQYAVLSPAVVEHNTFIKPANLSFVQAAFLEPLSLVMSDLRQLTIHPEDVIIIMGSGALGLLQLLAIKATASPKAIIMVGTNASHLQQARQLGADYTINAQSEDVEAAVKRYTADYGAQIVIDNANIPETWDTLMNLVSKAATLLICGGCPNEHLLELDTARVHYDQMTIIGSSNYSGTDVEQAYQLLASGCLDPSPLITASVPLAEVNEAFKRLAQGDSVKFAILP